MAIAVEQEKKPVNIVGLLIGAVVVATLFLGIYFFLFSKPEIIDVVLPADLKDMNKISDIPFQPEKVLSSEKFKILKKEAGEVAAPVLGKGNPFLP